jgi:hypothetical protein
MDHFVDGNYPRYADPVLALRILVGAAHETSDDVSERILSEGLQREIRQIVHNVNKRGPLPGWTRNACRRIFVLLGRTRIEGISPPFDRSVSVWLRNDSRLIWQRVSAFAS